MSGDVREIRHIDFFVPGEPASQGSMKLVGDVVLHNNTPKLMSWRNQVRGVAFDAMTAAGHSRFEGPVAVVAQFTFDRPGSVSEKRRPLPVVAPDLDKLIRAIGDALNKVVWRDDAQVVEWAAKKAYAPAAWSEVPGVRVMVREV